MGDNENEALEGKRNALSVEEYSDLVRDLGLKAHAVIFEGTKHLEKTDRWILVGRIVQTLFQNHFLLAYSVANAKMAEVVKAYK